MALGLRANWRQFWLLVGINAFVGAMDRALSSASPAGLVNNLNDGIAWGFFRTTSLPMGGPWLTISASAPPLGRWWIDLSS